MYCYSSPLAKSINRKKSPVTSTHEVYCVDYLSASALRDKDVVKRDRET